ncbi:MAG: hypothetical protein LUF89_00245 [Ruminococcus sp.]|nr:hypothetical protein [Ruminococcus sp.]
MTKYFRAYLTFLEEMLKNDDTDWQRLIQLHCQKIRDFQHERLVHLLVMMLVAICTLACFLVIIISNKITLIPLALVLLVLLVFYIKHYYFLENNVQLLYRYYDDIEKKCYGTWETTHTEVKRNANTNRTRL